MADKSLDVPSQIDLLWPMLTALKTLGGSAHIGELDDLVATNMGLSESILTQFHGQGPKTEFSYRCGWARTRLKYINAVENSSRGVWSITDTGRKIGSDVDAKELDRVMTRELRKTKNDAEIAATGNFEFSVEPVPGSSWQAELLEILLKFKPEEFERFCQLLLREHGFTRVEVTGRSGDGGIDGTGVLQLNLLSFHVNYQCKRWKESVGSREIGDFRGALMGRTAEIPARSKKSKVDDACVDLTSFSA